MGGNSRPSTSSGHEEEKDSIPLDKHEITSRMFDLVFHGICSYFHSSNCNELSSFAPVSTVVTLA